jgi:SulP family sulfate permease
MDASALHTLASMQRKLRKNGKYLILCGAHTQPYFMMHQAGFFDEMGSDNVTADLDSALRRATKLLEEKKLAQV